ncbi:MAG: hypothetical protein E7184_03325 [Erysipelotrichaceae bacterium]|nr:hypothetical protein [Erysipelotrichaceae bacterium]
MGNLEENMYNKSLLIKLSKKQEVEGITYDHYDYGYITNVGEGRHGLTWWCANFNILMLTGDLKGQTISTVGEQEFDDDVFDITFGDYKARTFISNIDFNSIKENQATESYESIVKKLDELNATSYQETIEKTKIKELIKNDPDKPCEEHRKVISERLNKSNIFKLYKENCIDYDYAFITFYDDTKHSISVDTVTFVILTGDYHGLEYHVELHRIGKIKKIKFNQYHSENLSRIIKDENFVYGDCTDSDYSDDKTTITLEELKNNITRNK